MTPAGAAPPSCAAERPGEATASALAKACGQRVEVADRRTETEQVFAEPSGSFTFEWTLEPKRVRRNGSWRPIDTTLRPAADGTLQPGATLADVRFSGGGDAPLAAMTTPKGPVELRWPVKLPAPVLDGDAAVYRDVYPGVDLQVQALPDGFTHTLVVRTQAATANPALAHIRYGLRGPGLNVRAAGDGVELVDAKGQVAARTGTALMWDSREDTTRTLSAAAGAGQRRADRAEVERAGLASTAKLPGEQARQATMRQRVSGAEFTIEPDLALLKDPAAVLPIYIDPTFISSVHHWTYMDTTNVDRDRTVMRVGHNTDGSGNFRSFFEMPTAGLSGKRVTDARLYATLAHSWSCASTPVSLYRTVAVAQANRIAWNANSLLQHLDERWGNAHKGTDACGNQPDMAMEFNGGLTGVLQSAAANSSSAVTLGFSTRNAAGANESTQDRWKKFSPGSVRMTAEYNSYPNTPDNLSTDNKACSGRQFVGMANPVLRAHVTDPDGTGGGQLTAAFEWQRWDAGTSTWIASGAKQQTNVPNDSVAQVTPDTALSDNGTYRWRAQTRDSASDTSAWSGWCEFDVDLTGPGVAPPVSSSVYLDDLENFYGMVGQNADFTFTSGGVSDVAGYRYGWVSPPIAQVAAPSLGSAVTLILAPPPPNPQTPTLGGISTLYVQSYDRTGRLSPERRYVFLVASVDQDPRSLWKLDEPAGATQFAETSGYEPPQPATVVGSLGRVPGHTAGGPTAVQFPGVGGATGYAKTTAPAVDVRGSFTIAAWVHFDHVYTDDATVFSQVDPASGVSIDLRVSSRSGHWWFEFNTPQDQYIQTTEPDFGEAWEQLVVVFDAFAGTLQVYTNGYSRYVTQDDVTAPTVNANAPFVIGAKATATGPQTPFPGAISDVRIWNRPLSEFEIEHLA